MDKINKLNSIENGIIELLYKKYKIDTYSENTRKHNTIMLEQIMLNINTNLINWEDLLNKYLEIESIICYYDIDILNLIFKYISINKTLEENDFGLKSSFKDTIYYYLGYKIENKQYKINFKHFDKKVLTINKLIKPAYLHITNNIIIPNSY
jgi:hypothetical protein